MSSDTKYRFGQLVKNDHAGDSNPYMYGMVIRDTGRKVEVLQRDGHISEFRKEKDLRLFVCGRMDFCGWDAMFSDEQYRLINKKIPGGVHG